MVERLPATECPGVVVGPRAAFERLSAKPVAIRGILHNRCRRWSTLLRLAIDQGLHLPPTTNGPSARHSGPGRPVRNQPTPSLREKRLTLDVALGLMYFRHAHNNATCDPQRTSDAAKRLVFGAQNVPTGPVQLPVISASPMDPHISQQATVTSAPIGTNCMLTVWVASAEQAIDGRLTNPDISSDCGR
jgi:hypothetical protein